MSNDLCLCVGASRWKQWDSCALVGRSPVIKIEENGPYIDKHEAVWRFNLAATQGFSNYVGKRTHLRLVNNGDSSRAMNGLAGKSEHSIFTVRVVMCRSCLSQPNIHACLHGVPHGCQPRLGPVGDARTWQQGFGTCKAGLCVASASGPVA
jgi:hypothetical protein